MENYHTVGMKASFCNLDASWYRSAINLVNYSPIVNVATMKNMRYDNPVILVR